MNMRKRIEDSGPGPGRARGRSVTWRPSALLITLWAAACESPAAPASCGPLPQVTVNVGETTTVTACFNDANGDMLSYTATSSNPSVATASISGAAITVRAVAPGNATVTVGASDPGGLQGQLGFQVMVPNRVPQPTGTMPSVTVQAGGSATIDVSQYFTEPDGQTLAYAAASSDPAVAYASVAGSAVTVRAETRGHATVTVHGDRSGRAVGHAVLPCDRSQPSAGGGGNDRRADDHGGPIGQGGRRRPLQRPRRRSAELHGGFVELGGGGRLGVGRDADRDREGRWDRPDHRDGHGPGRTCGRADIWCDRHASGAGSDFHGRVAVLRHGGAGQNGDLHVPHPQPGHGRFRRDHDPGDEIAESDHQQARRRAAFPSVPVAGALAGSHVRPDDLGGWEERGGHDLHRHVRRCRDRRIEHPQQLLRRCPADHCRAFDPARTSRRRAIGHPHQSIRPAGRKAGKRQEKGRNEMRSELDPTCVHRRTARAAWQAGAGVAALLAVAWVAGACSDESVAGPPNAAIASDAAPSAMAMARASDRDILVTFYEATDGPNWVNSENWLTDKPIGEWYGVDTDASGRVTALELTGDWDWEAHHYVGHGLAGPIPVELSGLAHLQLLDLGINDLSGPIPPELGNLANLRYLSLSLNELSGPIPVELASLANLERLDLGHNDLSGPIPEELVGLANLRYLDLSNNELSGSVLPELGGLVNLENLDLGNNNLSSGPIPAELGGLAKLTHLDLYSNGLSGSIPAELGGLANLGGLYLSENELSGSIPAELGDLANLRFLYLRSNSLSGTVPLSFRQLSQLTSFGFGFGNAGLCLPADLLTWYEALEDRDGRVCPDREVLRALYEAAGGGSWTNADGWLGDGPLGEWYGVDVDASGLVSTVDLAGNGLSGGLTGRLGDLGGLAVLRIGDNALSGRLPTSLSLTPLQELRYANTDLCVPAFVSFREWLADLRLHESTGVQCPPLSDREILTALYDQTGGPNWTNSDNWLTDAPLGQWHGVKTDAGGRVVRLELIDDGLEGPIPRELGRIGQTGGFGSRCQSFEGFDPAGVGPPGEAEGISPPSQSTERFNPCGAGRSGQRRVDCPLDQPTFGVHSAGVGRVGQLAGTAPQQQRIDVRPGGVGRVGQLAGACPRVQPVEVRPPQS